MTINMNDLRRMLRERQYKLTSQRQTILQAFIDHRDEHLSAEDIYHIVREQTPEIGLATVYRTLELLGELDILKKLDFGDGRHRYEINETSTPHHHHHLICLSCGMVKEFGDDLLETLETAVARKSNFKIVDHQLKFYGYCQGCQAKSET
ncbi:MAG: Fur family transcriptional regulator [Negativicutes bacterium]|nr:Fur family transcriptional regulator [Negativicutes bacterium]